ncbi:MAG: hypothetical protein ACYDDF_05485 [Thermoplasmatota archaeon]
MDSPHWGRRLDRVSQGSGAILLAVSVSVLGGWTFGVESLTRIVPGAVTVNPATAVALLCFGAALLLRPASESRPRLHRAVRLLAAAGALIGLLKLITIFTGFDFRVDEILFASQLPTHGTPGHPSRLAPNTAFSLALSGSALFFVTFPRTRGWPLLGTAVSSLNAFVVLLGYL